jgi:hypothetical protein
MGIEMRIGALVFLTGFSEPSLLRKMIDASCVPELLLSPEVEPSP